MYIAMQRIPTYFPFGIIPVAGAYMALLILFVMEHLNVYQIVLPRNLSFILAMLLTLFVFFSPVYLLAAIYVWKHKNAHKYAYDEHGVYQDGQMIVSWEEIESVEFLRKYDSWYSLGRGVWAKSKNTPVETPRGRARQRPSGSITFRPKTGFGVNQGEVNIPITGKVAKIEKLHRQMESFVSSSGWDAVFQIHVE